MRLNRFFNRHNRDFLFIPRHSFTHVKRILSIFVGPSRVVPYDPPVHYISQTLIHVYSDLVGRPDKQVNEPAIMPLDSDFLEVVHEAAGEPLSPELRGHRDSGYVPVPILFIVAFFVTFYFTQEVALDLRD
jgi:hypothetical protein